MANLSDILNEHGIKAADLEARSHALEAHGVEDRAALVKRQDARRNKKSYADAGAAKPAHLGRGVSVRTIEAALAGHPIPRVGRKKIFSALNSLLTSQKKGALEFKAVFGDVPSRKGKKTKK